MHLVPQKHGPTHQIFNENKTDNDTLNILYELIFPIGSQASRSTGEFFKVYSLL